jgi:DNA-binding MarR family transcriptional regulator
MTTKLSPAAAALTDIMLAVFRVNGRLLEQGDRLVAPLKLTSALWQVLGAVSLAGQPLTAPQIAEAMGITRQGAQKQINRLVADGLFEAQPNPRHERSTLYALTRKGARTYAAVDDLHTQWANALARTLPVQDLEDTLNLLNVVYERLSAPVPRPASRS